MSEDLFPYYERELLYFRQLAQEFSRHHPGAASRLLLEENRSADPHVERTIQAFALLAGRLHQRLDDDFPELTDALLGTLAPHYQAPIPSFAILQFELDEARGELPDGFFIPRGGQLHTSPVRNLPCKYRTAFPTTLWPMRLVEARFQPPPFPASLLVPATAAAILRLQFETFGGLRLAELSLDRLRLFLHGDPFLVPHLYEFLFSRAVQVTYRDLEAPSATAAVVLPPHESLFPVGFDEGEALLPYPGRLLAGYRLLTEFFVFPAKFLFLDLGGWRQAARSGFGSRVEVVVAFDRSRKDLEQKVNASLFVTGCSPVVNLFVQTAEVAAPAEDQTECLVTPDTAYPDGVEVYSIDEVRAADETSGKTAVIPPLYAFRHGADAAGGTFWVASRRPSIAVEYAGTDVFLRLVDHELAPARPEQSRLHLRITCTNRNLPVDLRKAGDTVIWELEAAAPLRAIRCLGGPTAPLRPALRRGQAWRLISHFNLNHLSLSDPGESLQAFREVLRLYDFSDPDAEHQPATLHHQLTEGIVGLATRRVVGRVPGQEARGFCRGVEVRLEFDEEKYLGTGLFLFASVLERFLSLYVTRNSFCQLVGKKSQEESFFKRWPPRPGELPLA